MKTFYLIGGTMGVGKTATCQRLKSMLPSAVLLDGDWCWDADPFVVEGTEVLAGQTLCIVEAMKLMNEIPSPQMGTVREVCIEDATPVEFGTVLFYVEPITGIEVAKPESE